jgi:hypothetical protein
VPQPELAEGAQPRQRFPVPNPVRGNLARDDIVNMTDGKAFNAAP